MGITVEQWRARIGGQGRLIRSNTSAGKVTITTPSVECFIIVVVTILLLIGGVEPNPGPLSDDIARELKNLFETQKEELSEQWNNTVQSLVREVREMKSELDTARRDLAGVRGRMEWLESKLDYQENQSRRNNLVFYGLDEGRNESWEESENLVKEVIASMGVRVSEMDIDRAHRVGSRKGKRPIIVRFAFYKRKVEVLINAKKLQNTGYAVSEDFSAKVRARRDQLKGHMATARERGFRASIRFDKLIVDGRSYSLEELQGMHSEKADKTPSNVELATSSRTDRGMEPNHGNGSSAWGAVRQDNKSVHRDGEAADSNDSRSKSSSINIVHPTAVNLPDISSITETDSNNNAGHDADARRSQRASSRPSTVANSKATMPPSTVSSSKTTMTPKTGAYTGSTK